ncbi:unnamed protein product [Polarella glacialis]|uniref:Uncharacterized protein n=1 Tax=Polarella glacialis TaxID=89957 RepID=A0A813J1G2_POLGL|nr:unnamed protein product [Polarella glacialis]
MRLGAGENRPALNPLIVHWAGTGKMRLWMAEQYLAVRFGTNMSDGICAAGLQPEVVAEPLAVSRPYASQARAVRCCERLKLAKAEGGAAVTKEDLAYWGCCDWRPIRGSECQKLAPESKSD